MPESLFVTDRLRVKNLLAGESVEESFWKSVHLVERVARTKNVHSRKKTTVFPESAGNVWSIYSLYSPHPSPLSSMHCMQL